MQMQPSVDGNQDRKSRNIRKFALTCWPIALVGLGILVTFVWVAAVIWAIGLLIVRLF